MSSIYFPGDYLSAPLGHIPRRRLPIGARVTGSLLVLTLPHRRNQWYTNSLKEASDLQLYKHQVKEVQIDYAGPSVFASQEHYYATVRAAKQFISELNRLPDVQRVSVTIQLKEFDPDPLTTRRIELLGALWGLKIPWSVRYLIDGRLPEMAAKVSEREIKQRLAESWRYSFMGTLQQSVFPFFHYSCVGYFSSSGWEMASSSESCDSGCDIIITSSE